jgi:hypothetical protein
MSDESFGSREQVVEADAEADLLDHFVGILGVNVVFYCLACFFVEVFWMDLDKVCNLGLSLCQIPDEELTGPDSLG